MNHLKEIDTITEKLEAIEDDNSFKLMLYAMRVRDMLETLSEDERVAFIGDLRQQVETLINENHE